MVADTAFARTTHLVVQATVSDEVPHFAFLGLDGELHRDHSVRRLQETHQTRFQVRDVACRGVELLLSDVERIQVLTALLLLTLVAHVLFPSSPVDDADRMGKTTDLNTLSIFQALKPGLSNLFYYSELRSLALRLQRAASGQKVTSGGFTGTTALSLVSRTIAGFSAHRAFRGARRSQTGSPRRGCRPLLGSVWGRKFVTVHSENRRGVNGQRADAGPGED
jgi:hypothetical protein